VISLKNPMDVRVLIMTLWRLNRVIRRYNNSV
jgi:hypothetical protein